MEGVPRIALRNRVLFAHSPLELLLVEVITLPFGSTKATFSKVP